MVKVLLDTSRQLMARIPTHLWLLSVPTALQTRTTAAYLLPHSLNPCRGLIFWPSCGDLDSRLRLYKAFPQKLLHLMYHDLFTLSRFTLHRSPCRFVIFFTAIIPSYAYSLSLTLHKHLPSIHVYTIHLSLCILYARPLRYCLGLYIWILFWIDLAANDIYSGIMPRVVPDRSRGTLFRYSM